MRLRKEPSLATRLDGYANIVFLRFKVVAFVWFILTLTLFFWNEPRLSFAFILLTFPAFYYWPTRGKVGSDLKLNNNEKEILNKKGMGL